MVEIAGRFELGPLIGGGATGSVYAGVDRLTGEKVAIKALRSEFSAGMPELVERFRREGELLRRLNHPNIVKILATVPAGQTGEESEGSTQYIVMEYVGGGSLADLLRREPRLPVARVVSIALELSDALSRAHHLEILHRDIKPSNILLAEDGAPRLSDFGLARLAGASRLTSSGSIWAPSRTSARRPITSRSSTRAPTSGLSVWCSTKCSPASSPSPGIHPRRSCAPSTSSPCPTPPGGAKTSPRPWRSWCGAC